MTQTVALQRGTTTIVANNTASNEVTLFTQSGGIATRVIVNQLTFFSPNAQAAANFIYQINFNSFGGFKSPLIFLRGSGGTAMTFIPGPTDSSANSTAAGTAFGPAGLGFINSATSTGVSMGQALPSQNTPLDFNNGAYQLGPTNFWMGPGDSLSLRIFINTGTPTMSVGYSFTTITES